MEDSLTSPTDTSWDEVGRLTAAVEDQYGLQAVPGPDSLSGGPGLRLGAMPSECGHLWQLVPRWISRGWISSMECLGSLGFCF